MMEADEKLDIADYLALVGRDLPQPEQYRYDVDRDAIRAFAYATPDSNALYLEDAYAADTRWRSIIAPPGYLYAHGSPAWLGKQPGIRDSSGKELTGGDNATESWDFYKPVRPGDTIISYGKIAGATIKHSRKLGPSVLVNEEMRYTNQRGEVVARLNSYSFRFNAARVQQNRSIARAYPDLETGQFTRNKPTPPPLPGLFPTPVRRYDPRRYFEDVEIGGLIPALEFGPIMAFDIGRFNAATAGAGYDRIGPQGHIPDAFAPGVMRIQWFGALLSRWGGPNSFVTHISQRNEEWVLVGFKIRCGATVTQKAVIDGRCLVDLDIWCESELGFRTNSGKAQIELESRELPTRAR